jgi:glyoxylase-like metal-dependent hydrolase (beta-lactamase superfamily II)
MKQIAPHVYAHDGYRGVTVGCILTPSGPICIDSPRLPSDARDWRDRIARLSDKPVRMVILTDANRDRILGVQYLGSIVVAHDLAWDKMKGLGDVFRQQAADSVAPCGADAAAEVASDLRLVLPQLTFTRKLIIQNGDSPIVLQHVGGTTPASIWVHLPKSSVLFTGDLATPHTHPLVQEADIPAWLEALDRIADRGLPAKVIVPGRSGPCNKAALEPMADYLNAMCTRVQALVRMRKSKADIAQLVPEFLARYPVADEDRDCTLRFIRAGLERLYDALKSKK